MINSQPYVEVPEALCTSVLDCTILVRKLNKSFGLITQSINILRGLYYMVFKKCVILV